jgi:hypothetical protein
MSLASEWAAQIATKTADISVVEGQRPPTWTGEASSASVVRDGGCEIVGSHILSSADALRLGQWLVATFG